jgi:hypothetical protein
MYLHHQLTQMLPSDQFPATTTYVDKMPAVVFPVVLHSLVNFAVEKTHSVVVVANIQAHAMIVCATIPVELVVVVVVLCQVLAKLLEILK